MLFTNRAFDLFDDMFNDPFFTRSYETTTTPQIMKADVQEIEKGYLLDIELPGRKDHHLVGFGLPETNRIP